MKKIILHLFFISFFFTSCQQQQCESDETYDAVTNTCIASQREDTTPVNDTMAVGYYSDGSLKNAEDLLSRSAPIHKLLTGRNRSFATLELVDMVADIAREMSSNFREIEKMQIGDLSAHDGGELAEHSSHQNGLDVDIVYFSNDKVLQGTNNSFWTQDFVKSGRITNLNLEKNWYLFKYLIANYSINRIFVDPVIKDAFCDYARSIGEFNSNIEVLRRLRPLETSHDTHFHIRMECPVDDLKCTDQGQPPSGSGC